MLRTTRSVCLSALALAATPSLAFGQEWKDQINNQILDSRTVQGWLGSGYTRAQTTIYDLLAQGASKRITLNLEGGRSYQIIGKCDNDCTDVDFRLFDQSDTEVDTDLADDDYPVVAVSPSRSGEYGLRVTMATCKTSTCGFGVVVFAKGAASGGSVAQSGGSSGASSGSSSTAWKAQIERQFENSSLVSSARADGYSRSHETQFNLLAGGANERVTFELTGGKSYQFIGKCDNDCSDLDLRLYDENENLLDSDVDDDDVPILEATAPRSGSYRLQVNMVTCGTAKCGWGVMVMGK